MEKSNESPNMRCHDIERLLVNRLLDKLTADENLSVEEHLRICPQCRSYQIALLNMQNTMQSEGEERLAPDPATRENVIRRMKAARSREAGILSNLVESVRRAFAYRIPVYQAALGVVLIVAMSLTLRHLPSSALQEPSEVRPLVRLEMPPPSEISVMDNLEVVRRQKIGRSVREDTTLTRFVVSGM